MATENNKIAELERKIIIARLEVADEELCFSSGGNSQTFSRDQLIQHIKDNDAVGKEFVKTEMEFLRAMGNGDLLNTLIGANHA